MLTVTINTMKTQKAKCHLCDKQIDWIDDGNDPVCEDCNVWCACGNEGINEAGFCAECI